MHHLILLLLLIVAAVSAQNSDQQLSVNDRSQLCKVTYYNEHKAAVNFSFCSTDGCSQIEIHDADADGELNFLTYCSASGEHCRANANNVIAPVSKRLYTFLVERRPSEVAVRLLGYPDTQEAKVEITASNDTYNVTVSAPHSKQVEWIKRSQNMSETDMVKWMERGDRVGFGRDWQDDSTENGTIVSDRDLLVERQVVWVLWDNGTVGMYYMGVDEKYELELLSPDSAVAKGNLSTLRDNDILGQLRAGSRLQNGKDFLTIKSNWDTLITEGKVWAKRDISEEVPQDNYIMGLHGHYDFPRPSQNNFTGSGEVSFRENDSAVCKVQYRKAYRSVLFFACNATACSRLKVTGSSRNGHLAFQTSINCKSNGRDCAEDQSTQNVKLPDASPLRAVEYEFIVKRNASHLEVRLIGHKTAKYAVVPVPKDSSTVKVKPLKEVDFMPVEFVFRSLNMSCSDMAAWMERGARVQSGRDWDWGKLEGNTGTIGTVLGDRSMILDTKLVWVKWDNGALGLYRMGADNKYDLKLLPKDAAFYKQTTPSLSRRDVLGYITSDAYVERVKGSVKPKNKGVIVSDWSTLIEEGKVRVKWDAGGETVESMGLGGKFDLLVKSEAKCKSSAMKNASITTGIYAAMLVVLTVLRF